jgi:UDP-2,3-diacylglucosamine hydrolase
MVISRIKAQSVLICSDLHLSPENLTITNFFCEWLVKYCDKKNPQERPQWLLILGDLFDHWIGDDLINPKNRHSYEKVIKCLKECFFSLQTLNISIGIMHGNRDFLMGDQLLSHLHAKQLAPTVILKSNEKTYDILLVHGDELCTDDAQHQIFRNLVKTSDWQNQFKSKPLFERQKIADSLREKSEEGKKIKTAEVMDVNLKAADVLLKKNNAHVLIHGHTHLPGTNILPSGKYRWVIPNWTVDDLGKVKGGGVQIKKNIISQILT